MEATIVPDRLNHYPVLLKEIISIISPQYGGTFIDCTFGQGGYTKEILRYQDTKVIGIDRDIKSKKKDFLNINIDQTYIIKTFINKDTLSKIYIFHSDFWKNTRNYLGEFLSMKIILQVRIFVKNYVKIILQFMPS